jgi:gliding motility-associated-like protein
MKKLIIISTIFFTGPLWRGFEMSINAQVAVPVMVNYGSTIYIANDTIYANGGISNFKDTVTPAGLGPGGTFRNHGAVYVNNGNWTNSAGNAAFTNTSGSNNNSTIDFFLVNGIQNIQGTSITEFHNLTLLGAGTKQLNGIDAKVKDTLNLNNIEFATGTNTLFVTNPDTASIQRSSGFVSSLNGGTLVRSTNSTDAYLFPVGTTTTFRPLEITPDNSSANDFAVRMADVNATTETFNTGTHEANINIVNPLYYHQITRNTGSATASIAMYYDNVDGKFSSIAHWQNQPEWEDITAQPAAGKYGLNNAMIKQGWDFSSPSPAFALIKLLNECGEMFVPNAFSPDNNGQNDLEFVYGKCIEKIFFAIYDRWGEKVFETTDATVGWDGTHKGKKLNTGVFVYYLTATLTTGEVVNKKGNISLFR